MNDDWIIRWRNEDGTWSVDTESTYTKRAAERELSRMRCLFGVIGQVWRRKEWLTRRRDAAAEPSPEPVAAPASTSEPTQFCEDEGCPHHGTTHICVASAGSSDINEEDWKKVLEEKERFINAQEDELNEKTESLEKMRAINGEIIRGLCTLLDTAAQLLGEEDEGLQERVDAIASYDALAGKDG